MSLTPTLATPSSPFHARDQFVAIVRENKPLCREHYRLVLRLDHFPATEPGQFVQLACRDLAAECSPHAEVDWEPGQVLDLCGRELMAPLALLRRPFSLAGRRDGIAGNDEINGVRAGREAVSVLPAGPGAIRREGNGGVELDIIHRVVGVGTKWLSQLRPGDEVGVLGPLGNRFALPQEDEIAVLVGGGVGIPPMLYLAEKLARRKAVAFCGALCRDLLPLTIVDPQRGGAAARGPSGFEPSHHIAEFSDHGIPSVITTDDGSYGFCGFVTQALELYLDSVFPASHGQSHAASHGISHGQTQAASPGASHDSSQAGRLRPVLYTCGPEPMMKRVAAIAAARGFEIQIAVERAMACGMGTCQSCVIRLKRKNTDLANVGHEWAYKLACTDGPVFRGKDLLW